MKKWIALLLACMMVFGSVSALGEEIFEDEPAAGVGSELIYTGPEYDYGHLVVGHTTALSGGFSTPLWGSNTSDLDVTALLNGYNLVQWAYDIGGFVADPTVVTNADNLLVMDDPEGNRSYYMAIASDLKYSDGTPINAYDYAFSILLQTSAQVKELEANYHQFPAIKGVDDYTNGVTNVLAGVAVPNENMLVLTVDKAFRPFFYELGLLWCTPMPIDVIAPGCTVKDDGEGCYIEGEFTADVLKKTMLDPATGYRTFPAKVSGPYMLTGFDGVTAEFEINPFYKGNSEGVVPQIKNLTYTLTTNETMISDLAEGKFGLINKVLNVDAIMEGMELVSGGNFAMASYPRIGQSHISFCLEKDTVSSNAVRQAMAFCMDKDAVVQAYSGNFGIRVDGYYGIGQWMYRVLTGAVASPVAEPEEGASAAEIKEYEETMAKWEELLTDLSVDNFRKYDLNVEEAKKLLVEDGWTLNAQGEAYTEGVDEYRCKMVNDQLVGLDLTMIFPAGNKMVDIFSEHFVPYLQEAGIALTMIPVEMNELRAMLHRDVERDVDMIYLATNFDEVFNPQPTFDPADAEIGRTNYTGIADEELYNLVKDMNATEPGDTYTYFTKWLAFQDKYIELLPELPIYGNAYFDFFTACLQDYYPSENVTWSEAIVYSYMSDPMMVEEEAEEDEDGLVSFD